jgi:peptidoglycan/xylan/chitin deacetylase (PgdA/CDA1 family)
MPLQPPTYLEWLFPHIIWRGPDTDTNVYLTFDDGPHPYVTPQVLDILSDHQVRASFFLVGSRIPGAEHVVQTISDQNHLIANHGFSHRKLGLSTSHIIRKEVEGTEQLLKSNGWRYHRLFRPPFGHFRPGMTSLLQRLGYRLVMWSLMPGDYRPTHPDRLLTRTVSRLTSGSIIVLHDYSITPEPMLAMLPNLLQEIKARGLSCKPLNEMEGIHIPEAQR